MLTSGGSEHGEAIAALPSEPLSAIGVIASFFPNILIFLGRVRDARHAAEVGLLACRREMDAAG